MARTPERLAGVEWRSEVDVRAADVVDSDVVDSDSLDDAVADMDAVYYLVHAMGHAGDFMSARDEACQSTSGMPGLPVRVSSLAWLNAK